MKVRSKRTTASSPRPLVNPRFYRTHFLTVLALTCLALLFPEISLGVPFGGPKFYEVSATAAISSFTAAMLGLGLNEAAYMDPAAEVKSDLWTIPPMRMKGEREHKVPLTNLALAQLPFRPVSDVTLSNCIVRHTNTIATTHGMRSTFRDWAGDCTSFPRDIAEMALAHAVSDETEAAYRRSTALAKRRELMTTWAGYCSSAIEG